MPNSALRRAATSAWGVPSRTNVASGNVCVEAGGPSSRTPGIAREAVVEFVADLRVVRGNRRPPDRVQLADRGVEGDGAEHVR